MTSEILPSSFRDPSGFIFKQFGTLYRQVNQIYKEHYDFFKSSGLFNLLLQQGLIVSHDEVDSNLALRKDIVYKVIQPQIVPMISYPYEWSFEQLKDAALLTLKIQKIALEHGMTLKDSSAYNIQFYKGKPILIDTLSFEIYREGAPWNAYGQFCRHFFAPLVLMSKSDIRLNQLLRVYMDGVPLDLASSLLSKKTYLNLSILGNIHLHAKYQKRYAHKRVSSADLKQSMKKTNLMALINSLETSVQGLVWKVAGTEWGEYYNDTNYSENGLQNKKEIVEQFLLKVNPQSLWDIGGNVGLFSRIASKKGIHTVCFDIDVAAVNKNYIEVKTSQEDSLLPLILDLTNPSPNIGWSHCERDSFLKRGPADMVFALALIHHLAISNHVPFMMLAEFFSKLSRYLLIEFVPKHDSQVQRLLSSRVDIFTEYTEENFRQKFGLYFDIIDSQKITDSERTLYLLKKK